MLGQVGGSAPHHGEDQLVQGTVVVDALDSTSWRSHDAPDFGLDPILSAISPDEKLTFKVSYKSSGEVDAPSPKDPDVWRKTIVKSVSKGRNLCIDISRRSEASESGVSLIFIGDFVVEEEIPVMFMEEFANAIRSNQRIERVHVHTIFGIAPDSTLVTRFRTLVMNMILVILENPSLQSVIWLILGGVLPLDRAAIESLVSALRRNLTLTRFSIYNGEGGFF